MPTDTEVQANYVKWAIEAISAAEEQYESYENYYVGDQPIAFATDRWMEAFGATFKEFADNWCQVVVDSAVQRLNILGWDSEDKKAAKRAEEIWDRTRGGLEADEVHTQAFVKGDSYINCWQDSDSTDEDKYAAFYYNDATEVQVFYDPENRRKIARAARKYNDLNGDKHLWLYFPEAIEHYIIKSSMTADQVAAISAGVAEIGDFAGAYEVVQQYGNPYGRVPLFHFKNRALGSTHGLSELKIAIPIQNSINKLLMDLMVGSEFGSFRQKYVVAAGQPRNGFRVGGDRVWATSDPNAKFGEFGQIDLEPIYKSVDALIGHIAKTTQTPMHYLRTSGDMPSGEAMKTAESGLVKKIKDRQQNWGWTWADVMAYAVEIETGSRPTKPILPKWESAETRHDLEQAQTAQLKSILGVPLEQLWSEHFNYTEDQIKEFMKSNRAIAAAVLAQVVAQVGQLPPGSEKVAADPAALIELVKGADPIGRPPATGDGASEGLNISQVLALLGKGVTAQTTAGESTTKPQPNTSPPASPTRRSTGFKD